MYIQFRWLSFFFLLLFLSHFSLVIPCHTYHSARQQSEKLIFSGEEPCMRAPVSHRNSKSLAGPHGNVYPKLPRGAQHGQCQKVSGTGHEGLEKIHDAIVCNIPWKDSKMLCTLLIYINRGGCWPPSKWLLTPFAWALSTSSM